MSREWRIHIVPASHLDYGWAASPGECLGYVSGIIRTAIEDMTSGATGFKFTVEYALFMKHFLDVYPEYKGKAQRLIDEGRLEVCPTMTGPIEHWLDGEGLIHQLVRGKRWLREAFGYDARTAQHTDLPGHVLQIPQFLHLAEIDNLAYSRYHPPVPLHRWRAPDGSEIVACCHQHDAYDNTYRNSWEGYGLGWVLFVNNADMELVYRDLPPLLERRDHYWPKGVNALLMGCESDLQPGDPAMLDRMDQWNQRYPNATIVASTVSDFFREVDPSKLPVYQGEAPYSFFAITAIDPDAASEMRRADNAVTMADKWSSFGELANLGRAQTARLRRARDAFFLPQDHNLGGRRGEVNDQERHKDAWAARLEGESIMQETAMRFMVHLDFQRLEEGVYPITVFNGLSWNRSDIVETYIELPMDKVRSLNMTTSKGRPVATQIVRTEDRLGWSRVEFVFVAEDVPAHGYETFYVKPSTEPEPAASSLKVSRTGCANDDLALTFRDNGISRVTWRGRTLTRKAPFRFNEIRMLEAPLVNVEAPPWDEKTAYSGKEWRPRMLKTEVIEKGPVRATVRFTGTIRGIRFEQDVSLYDRLGRVDMHHTVHYRPKADTQTRVSYPLAVENGEATYESPYGAVRLEADEMAYTFRGTGERWVQKWVDISNAEYGVTLATRHIPHRIDHETIEPILIRTATDCGTLFHHAKQEKTYTFEYALAPHEKHWKQCAGHRAGWEFNYPLLPCNWTRCFPIKPLRRSRKLPERDSFLGVDNDRVVVTALAPSQDTPDAFVVRVVEFGSSARNVTLTFKRPVKEAHEVNFLERTLHPAKVDGKRVRFKTRTGGIHSIRVVFSG